MHRTSRLSLACAVTMGVGLTLLGCGGRDKTRADSARGGGGVASDRAVAPGSTRTDYAAIVHEGMNQYSYGPDIPIVDATVPAEFDDPGQTGPITISIAQATRTAGDPKPNVIIARIVSSQDIPKLGILKDTNYVWQDQSDPDKDKWELYIIPQDSPLNPKRLKKGKGFTGGTHPGLHLVRAIKKRVENGRPVDGFVFGLCTDDCPSGHCGFQ